MRYWRKTYIVIHIINIALKSKRFNNIFEVLNPLSALNDNNNNNYQNALQKHHALVVQNQVLQVPPPFSQRPHSKLIAREAQTGVRLPKGQRNAPATIRWAELLLERERDFPAGETLNLNYPPRPCPKYVTFLTHLRTLSQTDRKQTRSSIPQTILPSLVTRKVSPIEGTVTKGPLLVRVEFAKT